MSGLALSSLGFFLFVAGTLHFFHVWMTHIFFRSVKTSPEWSPPGPLFDPVLKGLGLFVLGMGIVVMGNARIIAEGGRLAVSLCLLMFAFFLQRFYMQVVVFRRLLDFKASRWTHRTISFLTGYIFLTYGVASILLLVR